MSGTISYDFDPGQTVWVIDESSCESQGSLVRQATIVRVRGEVIMTGSSLKYDVRCGTDAGTKQFNASDIFATLSDAVDEYEDRLS